MPPATKDLLFVFPIGQLDAHHTGPDARDQRRVPRVDAELARLAGQRHELGCAGKDAFLGGNDIDLDGGGHGLGGLLASGCYCMPLAFSNTSSMVPTM
jgi:hypothetical protein